MNEQNLKPFKAGESRAKTAGQKGGVASGKARRERVRELLLAELDKDHMVSKADEDGLFSLDFREVSAGYSRRVAMVKKLVHLATQGDLKAMRLVLELTEGDDAEDGRAPVEA